MNKNHVKEEMDCLICCEGVEIEKNANRCKRLNHVVCEDCMRGWMEAQKMTKKHCTCPICREIMMMYIPGFEPGYMWNGTVLILSSDGRPEIEATYQDGFIIGCETTWYPTGRIKYRCEYGTEHLDGVFTYWNPDGTVWFSTRYENGKIMEESKLIDLRRRPSTDLEDFGDLSPAGF